MEKSNVLDKKNILEHMIDFAVNDEYDLIGYVNMETNMAYMYFGPNSFNVSGVDFVEEDYTSSLLRFAHNAVAADEQQEYLTKASIENIKKQFKNKTSYEFYVHVVVNNVLCVKKIRNTISPENPKMFYFTQVDVTLLMAAEKKKQDKLEKALFLAEKANNATNQFMSRMSHDMRTPMNGILGMAELSKGEKDPIVLRKYISKIEDSGQYLLRLINDTLDFQRIQSGKLSIHPEIVSAEKLFDNVVEIVGLTATKKGINFVFKNANMDTKWKIRADEIRLKQVFLNLLSNALKFTPAGGTIQWECKVLKVENNISHNMFVISDTGAGMSKEFMEDGLFKPFTQEYNDYTNQYAGSGLGLSIVKSLVELMGGTITVDSEINDGTTFTILLDFQLVNPQKEELQETVSADDIEKTFKVLQDKKILLVEDHPLNAEISKRLLEKRGCSVTWAQNGKEGLDTFLKSPLNDFAAILMDIRMPIMDGLTATKEIRKANRADATTIPIIAMTANAFTDDIQNCLEAGINTHISKPINPGLMLQTIAHHLQ